MIGYFEHELTVLPGCADADGLMSIHGVFGAFMDIAARHASLLGVGMNDMAKRGLFWVTARTKVHLIRRPAMGETVTVQTWPDPPSRIRGDRGYRIVGGGEVLVQGKTEWAVVDIENGSLQQFKDIYPPELEFRTPPALETPFVRVPDKFEGVEPYYSYEVRSTDIDVGHHMNNTAYIRALLSSFSNEALRAMDVRDIDVVYRASCYEGETLDFYKKPLDGGGCDIRMARGDQTILLARMV